MTCLKQKGYFSLVCGPHQLHVLVSTTPDRKPSTRYTDPQHYVTQPRGCAAAVPAAHLPPAWLWCGVLRGNSPASQTELGLIKAALLPQNNESPLRNTLMRSKFLSDKIRDDTMMSRSFRLLLPSGRR